MKPQMDAIGKCFSPRRHGDTENTGLVHRFVGQKLPSSLCLRVSVVKSSDWGWLSAVPLKRRSELSDEVGRERRADAELSGAVAIAGEESRAEDRIPEHEIVAVVAIGLGDHR